MSEAIALEKIEAAAREGATELDLSGLRLEVLPREIGRLTKLRSLDLRSNHLNRLPVEIAQLKSLQTIGLSSNHLSRLPNALFQLTNLHTLYLSSNQLRRLPSEILQLTNLRILSLSSNHLSKLPAEVFQLTNLQTLYFSSNQLSSLPIEIAQLKNLQTLDLSFNEITSLPIETIHLNRLQTLYLGSNQLSTFPVVVLQLTDLQCIDLSCNQMSSLPVEIAQLKNLQRFDCSFNQLSDLPIEIAQLKNLQTLDLSSNKVIRLPAEIDRLANLYILDLSCNQLSSLPAEIKDLSSLSKLDLRCNPLPIPPEILGPKEFWEDPGDVQEILDFYFRTQDPAETQPLYEAKFLIVGEAGAGKTSLAKKIENDTFELQPMEITTEGINVIRWEFRLPNGYPFRVNIWDFGGQEIYHQTHQFFLTERSLYALVADTRKENTDFNYWLKVVELLSDNSPVLIIKNEKQDRSCEVNDRQLRGEFTNLEKILATNLATNRGLPEIQAAIQHYITQLPHVGTPLPKLWVRVRYALDNDPRNTISCHEYYDLCLRNGLTDEKDMLRLSQYLHDLGVCLHFQHDPILKNTLILKPEWATTAVYNVLDTDSVKANFGHFRHTDLKQIWTGQHAGLRDELLQLMMKFKLCYEIPGQRRAYIAPHLLSLHQPEYAWDNTDNLILRYEYDFMPKGMLTQFIVAMHRLIERQTLVWKTGVVLTDTRARAEVIETYRDKKGEITIRVSGIHKKGLLAVIDHEFSKIHRSYDRLQYDTLIPCNCPTCYGSQTPFFYKYDTLRDFIDKRRYTIQCHTSGESVNVRNLIDDTIPQSSLNDFRTPNSHAQSMPETIRNQVFISYSHQDSEWLTKLQKTLKPMIRNQTLNIWDDTQIKPGSEWRKDIETALSVAKVAVLLVSIDFFNSDFIDNNELPPLLDDAKKGGLTILWIPVSYCFHEETPIEKYQAAHPPAQPLASLDKVQQDKALVEICKKIKTAFQA